MKKILCVGLLVACGHEPVRTPPVATTASAPVATQVSAPKMTKEEVLEAGVQAVIYGLPIVTMELTKENAINTETPHGMAAPLNQFSHVPQFPPASFKQVVRANVDTLYSSAFLDLSAEPLVLTVPDSHGRYYLLPIFDAWTDVIATPGTRTTGNGAGTFVIAGPNWNGTPPANAQVLKSPTNMAWILGRIQTNGVRDYGAVHALQEGFKLVPLSAFGTAYVPPKGTVDPKVDSKTPPVEKLKALSATKYFAMLASLLKSNPPPASDAPILAKLRTIGIVPGQPYDPSTLDPSTVEALEPSVVTALHKVMASGKTIGTISHGWHVPDMTVGNFGAHYDVRAVIALIAFGANLPEDAVYPTTFVDADSHPLDAANRYVIHFDAGQTPPVRAFWSVTLYDPDSFFVENTIQRQAVSSWMPLKHNRDNSIDLYIQHDSPGKDREANWLPAPASGEFNLTLRMYWPNTSAPSIVDGSWAPPGVKRVSP